MANKIVLVGTSMLIDLFRKSDKANAALIALVRQGYTYAISAVTEYEIYSGAAFGQLQFWNALLQKIQVFSFDKHVARVAVDINLELKRNRKQIAIPDLFIAATAMANKLPLATLNKKHFERIAGLTVID